MIVIWLLVGMLAVLCNVIGTADKESNAVTLEHFTPEKGYVPTGESGWTKIEIERAISVNVAEFTKASQCVRVVHFSVAHGPLDVVEVACDDSPLYTGLVLHEGRYLMYYTMVFIELTIRQETYFTLYNYYSYRIIDESTCNYVSLLTSITLSTGNPTTFRDTSIVKKENEFVCQDLIEGVTFPMSLLLYKEKIASIDFSKLDPIVSYNYGKPLGARIYQYKNGLVCYRHLRFYTFDVDLNLGLTMSCGPVQEVTMTEEAFYSGYVVITYDSQRDSFIMFLNPSKLYEPSEGDYKPPKCIQTTINLIEDGARYVTEPVTTTKCTRVPGIMEVLVARDRGEEIETNFEQMMNKDVDPSIPRQTDTSKHRSKKFGSQLFRRSRKQQNKLAEGDILDNLKDYVVVRRNDYNLAHDMGIVMLKFENKSSYKKGIFVVAKGIVLTGYLLEDTTDRVALDVSDKLYCNDVLMARKSGYNTYTVVIKTSSNECAKQIFKYKQSKMWKSSNELTLSKSDSDCNSLLTRKLDKIQQSQTPQGKIQP